MDNVILMIDHEQYWKVGFEKGNFTLDCKSKDAAFNCSRQLIRLYEGEIEIDHVIVQNAGGVIQATWNRDEFDNI